MNFLEYFLLTEIKINPSIGYSFEKAEIFLDKRKTRISIEYYFIDDSGNKYRAYFKLNPFQRGDEQEKDNNALFAFGIVYGSETSFDVKTNTMDPKVMSTLINILNDFFKHYPQIRSVIYSTLSEDISRANVYMKLLQQNGFNTKNLDWEMYGKEWWEISP